MVASATAKFVQMSPRKASLVAALIRGRAVSDARTVLRFTPKRATVPVGKALASAIANATNTGSAKERDLVVQRVLVDGGPMLKRQRPGGRGTPKAIRHRSCHITVYVTDERPEVKPVTKTVAETVEAPAKTPAQKPAPGVLKKEAK